jgi:hypothetical protein
MAAPFGLRPGPPRALQGPAAPLTNPAPGCGSGVLWRLSHEKPLVQDLLLEVAVPPHASAALVGWNDLAAACFAAQARP